MFKFTYAVLLAGLWLGQMAVWPSISAFPPPNFLLIWALLLAITAKEEPESFWAPGVNQMLWFAFGAGLLLDIYSILPFGFFLAQTLIFTMTAYYVTRLFLEAGINVKSVILTAVLAGTAVPLTLFLSGRMFPAGVLIFSMFANIVVTILTAWIFYVRER